MFCVFSEDVLSSPKAMWSSPDGTHLIYATFNDSNVGTVTYPWFPMATGLGDSVGAQRVSNFPSSRTVRYPRVSYGIVTEFYMAIKIEIVVPIRH